MQDHPDKNEANPGLDGLFRKSAEEFQPPYDPAAWQDMHRRLNRHDRTVFWKTWTRRLLPIGLLLLLLTAGYWLINRLNTTKSQPVAIGDNRKTEPSSVAEAKQSTRTIVPGEAKPGPAPAPSATPEQTTARSTVSKPTAVDDAPVAAAEGNNGATLNRTDPKLVAAAPTGGAVINKKSIKLPKVSRSASSVPTSVAVRPTNRRAERTKIRVLKVTAATEMHTELSTPVTGSNPLPSAPRVDHRRINPDYVPTADEVVSSAILPAIPPMDLAGSNENTGEQRLRLAETALLANRPAHWPTAVSLTDLIVQPEPVPLSPLARQDRLTGLSIQLVASPDLSAIGLRNVGDAVTSKVGTNLGLLLSYRLSNRWSLQTGVLHSLKLYRATNGQYVWPAGWYQAVKFDYADARCAMLDIPLNVRYDVLLRPRLGKVGEVSRWFLSGGVTSYVILNERYDYSYENPMDPRIRFREWEGSTGRYGFSELNLSAGYEQPISRRLSWQVEPFLKVPLRQIGQFKVRLITTGAFFSLRYRL